MKKRCCLLSVLAMVSVLLIFGCEERAEDDFASSGFGQETSDNGPGLELYELFSFESDNDPGFYAIIYFSREALEHTNLKDIDLSLYDEWRINSIFGVNEPKSTAKIIGELDGGYLMKMHVYALSEKVMFNLYANIESQKKYLWLDPAYEPFKEWLYEVEGDGGLMYQYFAFYYEDGTASPLADNEDFTIGDIVSSSDGNVMIESWIAYCQQSYSDIDNLYLRHQDESGIDDYPIPDYFLKYHWLEALAPSYAREGIHLFSFFDDKDYNQLPSLNDLYPDMGTLEKWGSLYIVTLTTLSGDKHRRIGLYSDGIGNISPLTQADKAKVLAMAGSNYNAVEISNPEQGEIDEIPPSVLSVSVEGDEDVLLSLDKIEAVFSEELDSSSVNTSTVMLYNEDGMDYVVGTMSLSGGKAAFTLQEELMPDAVYVFKLDSAIKDLAGNSMVSDYLAEFTTQSAPDIDPPYVMSVSPEGEDDVISELDKIEAVFSEELDPESVDTGTVMLYDKYGMDYIGGTVSLDGGKITFTFQEELMPDAVYVFKLDSAIKDLAGNSMVSDYLAEFTTQSAPDTTAPYVVSTTVDYAVDVSVSLDRIEAVFSEDIDEASLPGQVTLCEKSCGNFVAGYIEADGEKVSLVITEELLRETSYIFSLGAGIKDLSGNNLSVVYEIEFMTEPELIPYTEFIEVFSEEDKVFFRFNLNDSQVDKFTDVDSIMLSKSFGLNPAADIACILSGNILETDKGFVIADGEEVKFQLIGYDGSIKRYLWVSDDGSDPQNKWRVDDSGTYIGGKYDADAHSLSALNGTWTAQEYLIQDSGINLKSFVAVMGYHAGDFDWLSLKYSDIYAMNEMKTISLSEAAISPWLKIFDSPENGVNLFTVIGHLEGDDENILRYAEVWEFFDIASPFAIRLELEGSSEYHTRFCFIMDGGAMRAPEYGDEADILAVAGSDYDDVIFSY